MWWLVQVIFEFSPRNLAEMSPFDSFFTIGCRSRVGREVRVACIAFSRNFSSEILINLGELQCGNLPT